MKNRLAAGSPAPAFTVPDARGNPVSLEKNKGLKVLLSFQRGVMCPFCNLRVHYLNKYYESYRQRGMTVIVISESTRESILQNTFFSKIALTVVPDPDRRLYELYGVEASYLKLGIGLLSSSGMGTLMRAGAAGIPLATEEGTQIHRIPAEFLVDEASLLHEAYYGNSISDHIPEPTIKRFLDMTPSQRNMAIKPQRV